MSAAHNRENTTGVTPQDILGSIRNYFYIFGH